MVALRRLPEVWKAVVMVLVWMGDASVGSPGHPGRSASGATKATTAGPPPGCPGGLHLALRGGGKGGCKAKHLSTSAKGRHAMVTKHAFPNLRRGAEHAAAGGNQSLVAVGARRAAGARGHADADDSESVSSWEVEEQHDRFRRRIATERAPPPEAGLIPLTHTGARDFGAVEMAQSYMGRPIQIMRRARDPRDGDVWGWGANYDGQLGIAEGCRMDRWQPTRQLFVPDGAVKALAAGEAHSLILREDGSVLACGLNSYGQIGDGTRETRREPVAVPFPALPHPSHAIAIAAGATHSLAALESGELLAWGCNASGQLGPGPPEPLDQQIANLRKELGLEAGQVSDADMQLLMQELADDVPRKLPLALASVPLRKRRRAWQSVAASAAVVSPVLIRLAPDHAEGNSSPIRVTGVAGGPSFTIAVSQEGMVYEWGGIPWAKGGAGGGAVDVVPVPVRRVGGLPSNVVQVAAGRRHALALTSEGQVWAWGCNECGQVGGRDRSVTSPPVMAVVQEATCIAGGGDVSAACLSNGSLLVWGELPRQPPGLVLRESAGRASAGVRRVTELQHTKIASVVVGGDGHVMAQDAGGALYAWGPNHRGQCGIKGKRPFAAVRALDWGEKLDQQLGKRGSPGHAGISAAPTGVQDGPAAFIAAPGLVRRLPRPVTAMAAGMHHGLAITRV